MKLLSDKLAERIARIEHIHVRLLSASGAVEEAEDEADEALEVAREGFIDSSGQTDCRFSCNTSIRLNSTRRGSKYVCIIEDVCNDLEEQLNVLDLQRKAALVAEQTEVEV